MLTSSCDPKKLKLRGAADGAVGERVQMVRCPPCLPPLVIRGMSSTSHGYTWHALLTLLPLVTQVLHTYDHRNRRRSTGGDLFTCGLRNHGPPPEEGSEVSFLTVEEAAHDLGNGTHILSYSFERAGSFLFTIRLDGKIVKEQGITLGVCSPHISPDLPPISLLAAHLPRSPS